MRQLQTQNLIASLLSLLAYIEAHGYNITSTKKNNSYIPKLYNVLLSWHCNDLIILQRTRYAISNQCRKTNRRNNPDTAPKEWTTLVLFYWKTKIIWLGYGSQLSLRGDRGESLGIKQPCTRGIISYKRLMGMCRWMGWHLHDWSDYDGVAFSIELLEWGRTFGFFWGRQFLIFLVSNLLLTHQNVCTADEK